MSKSRISGFTLIEIMIVMVIVAMLAGAAVLVVGSNQQQRQLENEARKLVAVMSLTQDEAIFQNVEIGLRLVDDGYSFRRLDEAALSWVAMPQDFLQGRDFPSWLVVDFAEIGNEVEIKGPEEEKASFYPQILFFSSGENTPFQFALMHEADQQMQFIIQSDGLNGVILEVPGE